MIFIMLLIISANIFFLVLAVKHFLLQKEEEYCAKTKSIEASLEKFEQQKEKLSKGKMVLENEAIEIVTLYEITREITKSKTEEKAFEIFKNKLREHVNFSECILLDPLSEEIKPLSKETENFVCILKDKSKKMGALVIKGVRENDNEKIMVLVHQFALALRRVKLYEEIEKIAITDSLTAVHTRRYFLDRLKEEIGRSKKHKINMSFLMLDVDYFKKFNDEYGHLTGDRILREIGAIISDSIREIDIAGRYGGEEFCVVLPDTDKEGAILAAERIRYATEKTSIKAYDTTVKATLSIGISTFPIDGKSSEALIDKADWALYRAKMQGRNKVCSFGLYEG